jgi:hypothetical protein
MKIKTFLVLLSLLVAGFALGVLVAMLRGWGESYASVEVVNQTGQSLKTVVIELETCSEKTQLSLNLIAIGAIKKLRLPICGEGDYVLKATLNDGMLLQSKDHYLENGYRSTEKIKPNSIESIVQTLPY